MIDENGNMFSEFESDDCSEIKEHYVNKAKLDVAKQKTDLAKMKLLENIKNVNKFPTLNSEKAACAEEITIIENQLIETKKDLII